MAFLSFCEIMQRAGIKSTNTSETLDIVDLLKQINIIELNSDNNEAN
jgi:hypothetical protein